MLNCASMAVIGRMGGYPPALYFEQLLAKATPKLISKNGPEVLQAAAFSRMNRSSLVFCIAFPRYPRIVLELARHLAQKGANLVAITNSADSPLASICPLTFTVDVEIFSYIDLFDPVFALINVLCLEFSLAQCAESEKNLAAYDKVIENTFLISDRKSKKN